MDLSPIGEAVLIAREGRRLKAYRDAVGVWTIGVGHTSMAGAPTVTPGLTITSAECDAIFARDVQKYVAPVRDGLKVAVGQHTFDALVSACYNFGEANLRKSRVLEAINAGDMAGARIRLLAYDRPAVIIPRRQAEADQLVTPYASALPSRVRGEKPIKVAAPVVAVLHPEVPTPVIVPVSPKPMSVQPAWQPDWLALTFRWIDTTFGERAKAAA